MSHHPVSYMVKVLSFSTISSCWESATVTLHMNVDVISDITGQSLEILENVSGFISSMYGLCQTVTDLHICNRSMRQVQPCEQLNKLVFAHLLSHKPQCHILSVWDSPSPHVVLNALISSLEHPVVLFFTKKYVGFEQVLVERVHTSSQTALLANPLACLDINYIP